jgi:hypothetical protein
MISLSVLSDRSMICLKQHPVNPWTTKAAGTTSTQTMLPCLLVYVLFDCGNGLEKQNSCQYLSGKCPVHFADFQGQEGGCRHHETRPAGRKTVSRSREKIPSVPPTVPHVSKTLRHGWKSFPDMRKRFRQVRKPVPEIAEHPAMSGNVFVMRKNHHPRLENRYGRPEKHFAMLENGFRKQKSAAAIRQYPVFRQCCQKHGQFIQPRMDTGSILGLCT